MSIRARIEQKLTAALAPIRLEIIDDSRRHHGHRGLPDHHGHHPDGETHFDVTIISAAFAGQSRVNRQRQVYQVLAEEMAERVHALALTTLTPEEAATQGI